MQSPLLSTIFHACMVNSIFHIEAHLTLRLTQSTNQMTILNQTNFCVQPDWTFAYFTCQAGGMWLLWPTFKGKAFNWKFMAWPQAKWDMFGTFNDPNWIILMYKQHIYYIILEHQNYPIWVIKSVKKATFSIWQCQELLIKSVPLVTQFSILSWSSSHDAELILLIHIIDHLHGLSLQ